MYSRRNTFVEFYYNFWKVFNYVQLRLIPIYLSLDSFPYKEQNYHTIKHVWNETPWKNSTQISITRWLPNSSENVTDTCHGMRKLKVIKLRELVKIESNDVQRDKKKEEKRKKNEPNPMQPRNHEQEKEIWCSVAPIKLNRWNSCSIRRTI